MATRFKRTNIPNLDFAIDYGTYCGRVKLRRKLIRECLEETKRAGGRTVMLIHGRLRKGHSEREASRMQFLPAP